MAHVREILKAYETLCSHGLESLLSKSESNIVGEKNDESGKLLAGNNFSQLGFLCHLLLQGGYKKDDTGNVGKQNEAYDKTTSEGLKDLSDGNIRGKKEGSQYRVLEEVEVESDDTNDDIADKADNIIGSSKNPIRVPTLINSGRSFKAALMNSGEPEQKRDKPWNLKPFAVPRFGGGNLIVDLDEEDYDRGIEELQFSVVGRLFLTRGSSVPTTMNLRKKLSEAWGLENFKLVPMGGGLHHVILHSIDDQSRAMSYGPVNVSPGTFRVARWSPGFDPACLKTTTQIWVKLYGIPLEFRKGQNLLNIASAIGTPLRLDEATINLFQGLYARVLIDIDISKRLPERILASLKVQRRNINASFFVIVHYKQLPKYCELCRAIGHSEVDCTKRSQFQRKDIAFNARRRETLARDSAKNWEIAHSSGVKSQEPTTEPCHAKQLENTGKDIIESEEQNVEQGSNNEQPTAGVVEQGANKVTSDSISHQKHGALRSTDERVSSENNGASLLNNQPQTDRISKVAESAPAKTNREERWNPVVSALRDIEKMQAVSVTSRTPDDRQDNMDIEQISRLFPDDFEAISRIRMSQEQVRKNDEWERTKRRLEQNMAETLEKRKVTRERSQQLSVEVDHQKENSSCSRKWDALFESEEEQEDQEISSTNATANTGSIVPEMQVERPLLDLDPDNIYWDESSEIFVYASGMCYDPNLGAKSYYTLIDQEGGDLRPLYYIQSGGDFKLAQNGKFGQLNKVVQDDKSWDRKAVYNVKSPKYKPGLLKMFKEK